MDKDILHSYLRKSISLAPDRFRSYVVDLQERKLFTRFAFYRLKKLLDDFVSKKSDNRWVLLPGLRGTGKTTLLAQIYFYLIEQKVPQSDILYVSIDEVTKILGSDLNEIISIFEEFLGKNLESLDKNIFLLTDETHYDKKWAATLKSIFDRTRKVFIITTGSSSLSLQSNSDIARRAQVERLLPLSFSEYIMLKYRQLPIKGLKGNLEDALFFSANADNLYNRLKEVEEPVRKYWATIKPFEIETFLKIGTLPFAITLSKEDEVYARILGMVERVINEDIVAIKPFNKEILNKIWNLLLLFSVSEKINYDSICNRLNMSKPTLSEVLRILEKAELIYPVRPYGSVGRLVRKTPKYKFTAPTIKSSLLWRVGKLMPTPTLYGGLLEDTASLYLHKISEIKNTLSLHYDAEKESADFVLTIGDGSKIIMEVGYGLKGIKQIIKSRDKVKPKYSILICETKLEFNAQKNIVSVPKELFLLM